MVAGVGSRDGDADRERERERERKAVNDGGRN